VHISFTDRELDVMSVLWTSPGHRGRGPRAESPNDLAYTTVLTILRTPRAEGISQPRRRRPGLTATSRSSNARSPVGPHSAGLVDKVFDGSPEPPPDPARSDKNLSDEELRRLRKLLADRLREKSHDRRVMLYCCAIALLFVVVGEGLERALQPGALRHPLGLGGGHRRLVRRAGGGVAAAGCIRRAAGSGGAVPSSPDRSLHRTW